jgi:hypothetical protein
MRASINQPPRAPKNCSFSIHHSRQSKANKSISTARTKYCYNIVSMPGVTLTSPMQLRVMLFYNVPKKIKSSDFLPVQRELIKVHGQFNNRRTKDALLLGWITESHNNNGDIVVRIPLLREFDQFIGRFLGTLHIPHVFHGLMIFRDIPQLP